MREAGTLAGLFLALAAMVSCVDSPESDNPERIPEVVVQAEAGRAPGWAIAEGSEFWMRSSGARALRAKAGIVPGAPGLAADGVFETEALRSAYGAEGVAFATSSGRPFALRTRDVRAGAESLVTGDARSWVALGGTAQARLPGSMGIIEHHALGDRGTEVTWVVPRPVSGDLVVDVALDGLAFVGEADGAWTWGDATGPVAGVTGAIVVDRHGAQWEMPLEPTASGFAVRVPAAVIEQAAFPLAIDPVVFDAYKLDGSFATAGSGGMANPALAWNGTHSLAVYTYANWILGARIAANGTLVDPNGLDLGDCYYGGRPSVASAGGGFAVTCYDRGTYVVRMLDGSGAPVRDVVLGTSYPTLASDGTSYFVVRSISSGFELLKINASTGALSAPVTVVSGVNTGSAKIAAANGTVYVAWTQAETRMQVYAKRFGTDLSAKDASALQLKYDLSYNAEDIDVAAGPSGLLVVWREYQFISPTTYQRIYSNFVPATGAVASNRGTIRGEGLYPHVAATSTKFVLTARKYPYVSAQKTDLLSMRFSSTGAWEATSDLAVTTAEEGYSDYNAIGATGTTFLAIWGFQAVGSSAYQLRGSRLDASGARTDGGDGLDLRVPPQNTSGEPAGAWNGQRYLVAWADYRAESPGNSDADIWGRIVDADGEPIGDLAFPIAVVPGGQYYPSVAALADGTFVVVWYDNRPGASGYYGARVTSAGVVLDGSGGVLLDQPLYSEPHIAASGDVVLLARRGSDGNGDRLFGVRIDTTGGLTPREETLYLSPSAGSGNYCYYEYLDGTDVAADANGFTAVWTISEDWFPDPMCGYQNFGHNHRLGRTYVPRNGSAGSPQEMQYLAEGSISYAQIASDGDKYFMTWSEDSWQTAESGFYLQALTTSGSLSGDRIEVLPQSRSVVDVSASGGDLLLLWTDSWYKARLGRIRGDGTPIDSLEQTGGFFESDDWINQPALVGGDHRFHLLVHTQVNTGVWQPWERVVFAGDGPAAVNDAATTPEDIAVGGNVLTNDFEPFGLPMTATLTGPATHGEVALAADGTFTYTPDADWYGVDAFQYVATSDTGPSDPTSVTITVTAVNDAPEALVDLYDTEEDVVLNVPKALGVLDNDSDVEGTTLTAVLYSQPANGAVTLNADGSFSYTPDAGFAGDDTFEYRAYDGALHSAPTLVTVFVAPVNKKPVAVADAYEVAEDGVLAVAAAAGILSNDTDPDGDVLEAWLVGAPSHGALALQGDGSFTYTPDDDWYGNDAFSYRAVDGFAYSGLATVSIAVSPLNDAPTAAPESYVIDEDTALTVAAPGLLANDTDPDGPALSAVLVSGPANGSFGINANGMFVWTPNGNWSGSTSFVYKATDGTLESAPVTVSLTARPVDDAPTGQDDAYGTDEDVPLTVAAPGVLGNDTDPEGDALVATLVSAASHGQVALTGSGGFTYTPAPGWSGSDAFTYEAVAKGLSTGPLTVSLTVDSVNDAPVARDDAYALDENETLTVPAAGVLSNDTDADADALTVTVLVDVAHGDLVLATNGGFGYQPDADYAGTDAFTYTVSDGTDTDTATVTLTVRDVSSDPVAADDGYATTEDEPLVIDAAEGVLANDTFEGLGQAWMTTPPDHGTLWLAADGSFEYLPDADFNGEDAFGYRVVDDAGYSNEALVILDVGPWDDAPVAFADSYGVDEDGLLDVAAPGVLDNDSDPDGDPVTAELVTDVAHGTLVLGDDGAFLYEPDDNWHGGDGFTYRPVADDGTGGSAFGAPVAVTIAVKSKNDWPSGLMDTYAGTEDVELVVGRAAGLLANDTDPDGDVLTATLANDVDHGTLTLYDDGSFRYTPAAGWSGTDDFGYYVSDGVLESGPVLVTLNVAAVDDATVAVADAYAVDEDQDLDVAAPGVLGNDSDPDGDVLTADLVADVAHGTLVLGDDGAFLYEPDADWNGTDTFTYRPVASGVFGPTVTVSLAVGPVNDAPVGVSDGYPAVEDTPLVVSRANGVLKNDTDPDGDTLTVTVFDDVDHGTLVLYADGSFRYDPAPDHSGSDGFAYTLSDGTVEVGPIPVAIAIPHDQNDAPTLPAAKAYAVAEDVALTVAAAQGVLAGVTDPEGDPITATVTASVTHGAFTLNADGSFVYTPDTNFSGVDGFAYLVQDGANSVAATATITVDAINDAPVGAADAYAVAEDGDLYVGRAEGVLANDSDADADALSVAVADGADHGALTLYADGSFRYVPAPDFAGDDAFTYTLSDGIEPIGPIAVSITVDGANDAPVVATLAYEVGEDDALAIAAGDGVLAGATDADADALTVALTATTAHGALTLNADGSFDYTPAADFAGSDAFAYTVGDGTTTVAATAAITVVGANDAPTAEADAYEVSEDGDLVVIGAGGVLDNDGDVDGDALTATLVADVAHGTLALYANGSFLYWPADDFAGTDGFTYEVSDGTVATGPVAVTLTVAPENDAPIASAEAYPVDEDGSLVIDAAGGVLANDTDADDDALTAVLVADAQHGALALAADGSFTYEPDADWNGDDAFTYAASDGTLSSAPVVVSLPVNAVNDAPIAVADAYDVPPNAMFIMLGAGNVLANDSDPDGDALVASLVGDVAHGDLTLYEDGSFLYLPETDFDGSDGFTYAISDGTDTSEVVAVTLAVGDYNDPPLFVAPTPMEPLEGTEGVRIAFTVAATDTDGPDALAFARGTLPAGATFSTSTRAFAWTPTWQQAGEWTLSFSATDGEDTTHHDVVVDVSFVDADNDGVADTLEAELGLTLGSSDTDGDGVSDEAELGDPLDPWDSDDDGIIDALDDDSDNDGIKDGDEGSLDSDGDGTPDYLDENSDDDAHLDKDDNCPAVPNDDQADLDGDGKGDVCDDDQDGDGLTDADEIGLGLDPRNDDHDGDGVIDGDEVPDPSDAADSDNDGIIDAAEIDADNDTVLDGLDNCRTIPNTDQADLDLDGFGDLCDDDRDGDGLANDVEPGVGLDPDDADSDDDNILDGYEVGDGATPSNVDDDGQIDALDKDTDGDGILDIDEAGDADLATPPFDRDGDGIPDFRDTDADGDGVPDADDVCPFSYDPAQHDGDGDGVGDGCDGDLDGDGAADDVDNCLYAANADQADADADGTGDACDPDFVAGDGDTGDDDPSGCGCDGTGGASTLAWLLAAALVVRRRRAA